MTIVVVATTVTMATNPAEVPVPVASSVSTPVAAAASVPHQVQGQTVLAQLEQMKKVASKSNSTTSTPYSPSSATTSTSTSTSASNAMSFTASPKKVALTAAVAAFGLCAVGMAVAQAGGIRKALQLLWDGDAKERRRKRKIAKANKSVHSSLTEYKAKVAELTQNMDTLEKNLNRWQREEARRLQQEA